ncbi:hypothetical protein GEMRC1_004130 [Eukaryota sp. GEM-RC1]
MDVIGIDLGTTQSCVCHPNDLTNLLPDPCGEGRRTIPSVLYFPPTGPPVLGTDAKRHRSMKKFQPTHFIHDTKRLIGRRITDESVTLQKNRSAYSIQPDADGKPVIIVIAIPSYFTVDQRRETVSATTIAGLEVVRTIQEPTAALVAVLNSFTELVNKTILVFDWGGGTFDVSIIRTTPKENTVLAIDGDSVLGGGDVDEVIYKYAYAEFMTNFPNSKVKTKAEFRLHQQCEAAKLLLSSPKQKVC